MNNADYWARRLKIVEETILNDTYKSVQEVERVCEAAIADCDTLIRAWYQRLAANNNVSYAGARKLLVADELEEFKWTVGEYIKKGEENAISGEWAKQLENASARHHISKYEALKLQLQHRAELVSKARTTATANAAKHAYTHSYYHTAFEIQRGFGAGYSFEAVDDAMLDKMLAKPWTADGQTFSSRIWSDRNKLVDTIQQELTRLLVTGSATPDKAIAAIASKFKTAKENAGRLVMTESSYFASIGQRDCYKELDVEQYQVVGTLDDGTCDKCSELDGKVFPMSAYQPGLTANPFHPWCRCCTAPYFADMEGVGERYARDIETGKAYAVSRDTTYKQWRNKFVSKETLTKRAKNVKMLLTKREINGVSIGEPMPEEQFSRIKKRAETIGILILSDEDSERYVLSRGAEGITLNANTVCLMRNPSRVAVFEELIHTSQYRSGKIDGTPLSIARAEVEAKTKILRNAKAYNLTKTEINTTRKILENDRKALEQLLKGVR